jgi:hypothetical protein
MAASFSDRPRSRPARLARRLLALSALPLLAAGAAACRTAGARQEDAAASRCVAGQPGVLRIANYTGRVVDIYALRPVDHWRTFVAQVSIGTTELDVPGPDDMTVRYDAIEPAANQWLGTVNWINRASRHSSTPLLLELDCVDVPA